MLKGKSKYDEEFKKTILELYNKNDKSVSELSREYGISRSVLYKWINDYKPIKTDDGETTNIEIKKLKKELNQTKEENEILKKAIAIFTQK